MKKVPLCILMLIIGKANAEDNTSAGPVNDIASNSQAIESSEDKQSSTQEMVDDDPRKLYRFNGLDLLNEGNSIGSQKLSTLDRLSKIMESQLTVRQLISADLVSESRDGKPLRGVDAVPKVLADNDSKHVDLSFQIELRYDKQSYYQSVVPNLVSALEEAAVKKLADSVSVEIINKRSSHKQMMPVTKAGSFPIYKDLFLTTTAGYLQFGGWKCQISSNQDSIYVACNLGRDARGNHQRFSIYELDRKTYDPLFKNFPGRAIPPLHLVLEDANGSIIRQDSWNPGIIGVGKNESTSKLRVLSPARAGHLYQMHGASFENPLYEGWVQSNNDIRVPCYTIAPWFTYSSGFSSRCFFTDGPVVERNLNMDYEDLKSLTKVRLFFAGS